MNRFEEMQETHDEYFPIYESIVHKNTSSGENGNMLKEFVIDRIGSKKGIRGYVLRKMHELVGGDWREVLPIISAVEMHLASMYCFNVAADNKAGYDTEIKRKLAFETKGITFGLALDLISQGNLSSEKAGRVKELFIDTDKTFYEGETLDLLSNTFPVLEPENKEIKERYGLEPDQARETLDWFSKSSLEEKLLYRTYGINAALFENLGNIVGVLNKLGKNQFGALASFGKNYGLAMQIINDVQDYSLDLTDETTREKSNSDVFSDLKERKITWPIMYHGDLTSVPFGNLGYAKHDAFRETLCKNGALKRCVLEAMAYSKKAMNNLSNFPEGDSKKKLKDAAFSISGLSKYVRLLEERYDVRLVSSKNDVNQRVEELMLITNEPKGELDLTQQLQ